MELPTVLSTCLEDIKQMLKSKPMEINFQFISVFYPFINQDFCTFIAFKVGKNNFFLEMVTEIMKYQCLFFKN